MVDRQQHWEGVYRNKAVDEVSWFQPHAASSLRLIEGCADKDARIIDVGGGASVLVDGLLDAGYRNLTVLDLAETALSACRTRLGARAASVQWIAGDITQVELPAAHYDVWHDRAVFHFLTDPADRARYVEQVLEKRQIRRPRHRRRVRPRRAAAMLGARRGALRSRRAARRIWCALPPART